MKNIDTKKHIILVGIIVFMFTFHSAAQSYFYYYQGEKISIELDVTKVFVKFNENAMNAEKLRTISSISLTKSINADAIQYSHNFAVIDMKRGISALDITNTVNSLNANSSVMVANPFFTYSFGGTSQGITEKFIVKLKKIPIFSS